MLWPYRFAGVVGVPELPSHRVPALEGGPAWPAVERGGAMCNKWGRSHFARSPTTKTRTSCAPESRLPCQPLKRRRWTRTQPDRVTKGGGGDVEGRLRPPFFCSRFPHSYPSL